jgi:toxin ParE1/3/4
LSPDYVLTEAAEADMRDIIRYTRNQWGDAQVRRYIARLEQGIGSLAAPQRAVQGHERGLSGIAHGSLPASLCFCLPRENAPALIVAISMSAWT